MRYAIISDVHANPKALKKVLRDARAEKADKIVCLGDVVGYGPDPVGAVATCRKCCDVTLMGNHDAAVAGVITTDYFIPFACDGISRHQKLLGEGDKAWLGRLPYVKKCPGFVCAHGSIDLPEQFKYIMDAQSVVLALLRLAELKRRVLFVGHTHRACVFDYDPKGRRLKVLPPVEFMVRPRHRYIVNVGSVGYPRNDHHTTYVLYDTDTKSVRFRNLKFDFASYVRDLQDRNVELPPWLENRTASCT